VSLDLALTCSMKLGYHHSVEYSLTIVNVARV
jgi:hypothetical protein